MNQSLRGFGKVASGKRGIIAYLSVKKPLSRKLTREEALLVMISAVRGSGSSRAGTLLLL